MKGGKGTSIHATTPRASLLRNALGNTASLSTKGSRYFEQSATIPPFTAPLQPISSGDNYTRSPKTLRCFKVWEEITTPIYANQARYGARAGQRNPRFLDAKLFNELVLTPYREAKFEPHTGPFLFEFQRHGIPSEEFCTRLDEFFRQLPVEFRYAVEIRNADLIGADYREVLRIHNVAHVYNHWSYMPSLIEQHRRIDSLTAPFTVRDCSPR
jgi:hypothetical protein